MIDTSDFLQADDINKVAQVAEAVSRGHHTDDAIESYIGVNSAGRQGRYYRLAAEKMGLVDLSGTNHTILTQNGNNFVRLNSQQKANYLRSAIQQLPVFNQAILFINTSRPSLQQLQQWFMNSYPGEDTTAVRRFSTFIQYLRYCNFPY